MYELALQAASSKRTPSTVEEGAAGVRLYKHGTISRVGRRLSYIAVAMAGAPAAAAESQFFDRLRASLWGMHIGDALAMPAHWYYGGAHQIRRDYGSEITGYIAPTERLPGSIMSLSDTGGGGRGSDQGTVVGDIILHGKRKYWARGGDYHYHRGMTAGENTLEVTISRRAYMDSLVENGMELRREDVRERYITLMTTPDSHNDTYAGTCHRMFFANRANGLPLDECPDNDQHNVDTIDGLVNLVPVVCAAAAHSGGEAAVGTAAGVATTLFRRSSALPQYGRLYGTMLLQLLEGGELRSTVTDAARAAHVDLVRMGRQSDPTTA